MSAGNKNTGGLFSGTSIRRKLITIIMIVSSTALLLSCILFLLFQMSLFKKHLANEITSDAKMIANNCPAAISFDDSSDALKVLQSLESKPNLVYASVIKPDGTILAFYRRKGFQGHSAPHPDTGKQRFDKKWFVTKEPVILDNRRIGTIFLQSDLSRMFIFRKQILTIVGIIFIVVLLAALFLSSRLQKLISGPVEHLTETAKNISLSKNYSIRATHISNDEIGLLTKAFNNMLSEIEQAEQKLIVTEKKQRSMIANIADVIAILDKDGAIKYKSPNIEKHFGWNSQDLVGASGWETVHADDLERILKDFHKILQKQDATTTVEYRYKCKDNSYKWVELTAKNLLSDPDINGILLNYHNISERKEAEKKLADSEKQSRAWLENSPVCTKIVDLDFNLQYMSPAGVEALELDNHDDIFGKPYPLDFYPEEFKATMGSNLRKVKKTGEIITQEAPVVDINGHEIWFHSTLVPVNDDAGKLEYIMVVSVDTTERKRAEKREKELQEQLARSERMKSLGVLAGGVAHDLNNVLGPMVVLPEIIEKDLEDANWEDAESKEQVYESLTIIEDSAKRASVVCGLGQRRTI